MAFRRVRGTRDFLPDEQRKRIWIMDRIKEVYERYGFEPLESPALETFETLSNKQSQETLEEIYSFKDRGGRLIGLRFDLTVPLARIVGSNKSLPKPFKRYCISRAWRYERPQAGRYREFYQADADIVGVKGMEADAECLACAVDALRSLGFKDFEIRLNNRKILT
ncbi:MAG: histidine--tRNA ligase, partial [Candidatus Aenigmatarchaeota archaeon]